MFETLKSRLVPLVVGGFVVFAIAIGCGSNDAEKYYNQGKEYSFDLGDQHNAITSYGKALESNPDEWLLTNIYLNRGIAYYELEDYEEAIEDFNRSIDVDPNYALAFNIRAMAYNQVERWGEALTDLDKAIELDPSSALYYKNRGSLYHQFGYFDSAITNYDKALQISPNDQQVIQRRQAAVNKK